MGLNYNTAKSVDALHAKYPDLFFFESESSSETSSRGVYQDPSLLNTGENYTPGKRLTSSYDNNLASWTMSGEYGLKKDRDRKYFLGQFLWAGIDYIGEPTPYDVFPVKGGFWGAVDSALFPKDMYYLFQSQWATKPMVHLLPMNWTDHEPVTRCRCGPTPTSTASSSSSTAGRWAPARSTARPRPTARTTSRLGGDQGRQDVHAGRQLHEPKRRHGKAAPDLEGALREGCAAGRRPGRGKGRGRRPGRHGRRDRDHEARPRRRSSPREGSPSPSSTSTSSTPAA